MSSNNFFPPSANQDLLGSQDATTNQFILGQQNYNYNYNMYDQWPLNMATNQSSRSHQNNPQHPTTYSQRPQNVAPNQVNSGYQSNVQQYNTYNPGLQPSAFQGQQRNASTNGAFYTPTPVQTQPQPQHPQPSRNNLHGVQGQGAPQFEERVRAIQAKAMYWHNRCMASEKREANYHAQLQDLLQQGLRLRQRQQAFESLENQNLRLTQYVEVLEMRLRSVEKQQQPPPMGTQTPAMTPQTPIRDTLLQPSHGTPSLDHLLATHTPTRTSAAPTRYTRQASTTPAIQAAQNMARTAATGPLIVTPSPATEAIVIPPTPTLGSPGSSGSPIEPIVIPDDNRDTASEVEVVYPNLTTETSATPSEINGNSDDNNNNTTAAAAAPAAAPASAPATATATATAPSGAASAPRKRDVRSMYWACSNQSLAKMLNDPRGRIDQSTNPHHPSYDPEARKRKAPMEELAKRHKAAEAAKRRKMISPPTTAATSPATAASPPAGASPPATSGIASASASAATPAVKDTGGAPQEQKTAEQQQQQQQQPAEPQPEATVYHFSPTPSPSPPPPPETRGGPQGTDAAAAPAKDIPCLRGPSREEVEARRKRQAEEARAHEEYMEECRRSRAAEAETRRRRREERERREELERELFEGSPEPELGLGGAEGEEEEISRGSEAAGGGGGDDDEEEEEEENEHKGGKEREGVEGPPVNYDSESEESEAE
ncbi:hypothetical protein EV356DRAFT_500709 [Viridothelium virens]|uniref:Uncharacterized protein n=1 Tax=Viridothelium virens TaxID=1048519 RepID=A0A6A6HAF9_VIRVR|nr:hypothetical protein EV356DRAFT_500709 [Viridothelium virens]